MLNKNNIFNLSQGEMWGYFASKLIKIHLFISIAIEIYTYHVLKKLNNSLTKEHLNNMLDNRYTFEYRRGKCKLKYLVS